MSSKAPSPPAPSSPAKSPPAPSAPAPSAPATSAPAPPPPAVLSDYVQDSVVPVTMGVQEGAVEVDVSW